MASKRELLRSVNGPARTTEGGDLVDTILNEMEDTTMEAVENIKKNEDMFTVDSGTPEGASLSDIAPTLEPETDVDKPTTASTSNDPVSEKTISLIPTEIPPVVPKVHRTVYLTVEQANRLKVEEASKRKEPSMTKLMEVGIAAMLDLPAEDYTRAKAMALMSGKDLPNLFAEMLHEHITELGK